MWRPTVESLSCHTSGSQVGAILSSWGHSAMSGDVFGCCNWAGGSYCHPVGGDQMLSPCDAQDSPPKKNDLAQKLRVWRLRNPVPDYRNEESMFTGELLSRKDSIRLPSARG